MYIRTILFSDCIGGHDVQVAEPVRHLRPDGAVRGPRGSGFRRQDAREAGPPSAVQHAGGPAAGAVPRRREPGAGDVVGAVLAVQGAVYW